VKKIAQNVAKIHFYKKISDNLNCGKRSPKIWATSVIKKMPKVNNHSMGGNSPNLVTLMPTNNTYVQT
jgi:hypothetical protein